jgi:hypothetical protein
MARELPGLRTARVKYGQEVSVIDLSAGGVLFETPGELQPDSTIVLEFQGPTKTVVVPSRVLRCHSLPTRDKSLRSESACAFKQPLSLEDLVGAVPLPGEATPDPDREASEGGWQQVVGRYRDGRLVRGYTNDFSPMKNYLHVSSAPFAEETEFISMIHLDALFFMRDARTAFRGEVDDAEREGIIALGRKVAIALPNGTELIGSTLGYRRDGSGFFVHPHTDSGPARVFVTQSGIRKIRFL